MRIIRRAALYVLAALFLIVVAFAAFGPTVADWLLNPVAPPSSRKLSARASHLNPKLVIVDLHADSLMSGRDLLRKGRAGHVDIPRMIEGNVALQVFDVVTKGAVTSNINRNENGPDAITIMAVAERWPRATWTSLKARVLYQAGRLRDTAARSGGQFTLIRTSADLDRYLARRKRDPRLAAGLLGVEGAHALEGDPANVEAFYKAGVRMMSPTHFFDNEMAGSMQGVHKGGLTPRGREMVRRMERDRMIVDLAHSSSRTIDDVLAVAARPVLVSHTGVKGTCDNNRNLSDSQIRAIASKGGLIGIMYWDGALCGSGPDAVARAIRYTARVAGVDHVALGSDFDGSIKAPFDAAGTARMTDALAARGFTDDEIAKIMGGNAIRFLKQNLPK